MEASRRFKVIQEQVVEKTKYSQNTDISDGSKKKITRKTNSRGISKLNVLDLSVMVTDECRQFVNEHDYGYFRDPFPDGDLEAQRMLGNSKDTTEVKVPEHQDFLEETNVDLPSPASVGDNDDLEDLDADWEPTGHQEDALFDIEEEETADKFEKPSKDEDYQPPMPRKRGPPKKLIHEEGAFFLDNGKLAFRCDFPGCGLVYREKPSFQSHKLRHSSEPPSYLCDQCHKTFISPYRLRRHIAAVHTNPRRKQIVPAEVQEERKIRYQRQCPHCPTVTDKYTLAKHIKMVHENVYPFHCQICGKGQYSKKLMNYHQAEAHGICSAPNCKFTFPKDRPGLWEHQLQVHGQEIDVWKCHDCDKLFTWLQNLQNHRKVVHDKLAYDKKPEGDGEEDKHWICHLCGRQFRLKVMLSSHMGNHRRSQARKKMRQEGQDNHN